MQYTYIYICNIHRYTYILTIYTYIYISKSIIHRVANNKIGAIVGILIQTSPSWPPVYRSHQPKKASVLDSCSGGVEGKNHVFQGVLLGAMVQSSGFWLFFAERRAGTSN